VLVDNENRACLTDFDLEDVIDYTETFAISMEEQDHNAQQGAYVAPELLDGKSLEERRLVPKVPADIHSFGVLIYEVLSCVFYFTVAQAQHSGRCFLGNCPFAFSTVK